MPRAARLPALCLGLLLATGCAEDGAPRPAEGSPASPPPPPATSPEPPPPEAETLAGLPDIVLVTIDTLRREHLGCYGYFRPTSPHLDALAAEGLVFERALASMASTLPSHLSMLTGLYPHQHGMNSNLRGAVVPFVSEPGRRSAVEVLARAGYRTAAFVSALPLAPETGVSAGFGTYSCFGKPLRAGERNAEVLAWLGTEAPKPGPIFLWVHYFDPHEPNDPVAPYDTMFPSDARQEEWIRARRLDYAALTERLRSSERIQEHFLPPASRNARGKNAEPVTPARIADLMNRYDGEVRYADEHLGQVLAALRRHGRYDGAIVVVVGDHGQSLGENNWFGHGTPTDINAFVPLVLRLPSGQAQPRRVRALVSLTDLMPTLLARFALPGSEELRAQFQGEDVLSGTFVRDEALVGRSTDIQLPSDPGPMYALLSGPWKFIHRTEGHDELYDLSSTGEFVDVLARRPEVGERLRARTLALLAQHAARTDPEATGAGDERLLKGLRDLGYGGEDGD